MKKSYYLKSKLGRKNVMLSLVALILIMLTFVSVSYSWIEEVSNVELTSNDDAQQTPLHISAEKLDSDIEIENNVQHPVVDLNSYFYRSGDMHLSACYSDGNDFKFPLSGNSESEYRNGTKDDANTNYLSVTFKIKSKEAATSYWFEKIPGKPNFFSKQNYTGTTDPDTKDRVISNTQDADSNVEQYIRASITVNGATTVYAFNDSGSYKTDANTTCADADKKPVRNYMYYIEDFNDSDPLGYYSKPANKGTKYNQGTGDNLNGNTLFTVGKNKTAIVTVKIWLEKGASVDSIDFSNINLQLTSSWAKTRRIYVRDVTVDEWDASPSLEYHTGTHWLGGNGKLYWAINDNDTPSLRTHWKMENVPNEDNIYYVDIPAVYNGVECSLYRCNGQWNAGNSYNGDINYWDKWTTTAFPNTFHSETFSVFSHKYATWEETTNTVYMVDSADFIDQQKQVMSYMWDSSSVIQGQESDVNAKVVKNADWPGKEMTRLHAKANNSMKTYALFFSSTFDRAVFNDGHVATGVNQEYQTQDLWLTSSLMNCTFDMATLTWFHTNPTENDWSSKMPSYTGSNTYIYGNFSTNNVWKKTRFAYGGEYSSTSGNAFNGSSSTHMLCKIYCKAGKDYEFKLRYNNNWYGAYNDGDKRVTPNTNYYIDGRLIPNNYELTLDNNHTSNFIMKGINAKDIIRIYLDTNEMKLYFAKGEN